MSFDKCIYEWHGYKVDYLKFGEGAKTLVCWHGFGQEAKEWLVFQPYFQNKFTVFAITLFHHGKSTYPDDMSAEKPITPEQQKDLLIDFFQEMQIVSFSVLAFSIGARLALWSCVWFGKRIERIYLLSPDGLPVSLLNRLAVNTTVGKMAFKYVVFHPRLLYGCVKMAYNLKIISEKMYKFFIWHFDTKKQRLLVFNVWHAYSKLNPPLSIVKESIAHYNIKGCVVAGQYDPLSHPKKIKRFIKNNEKQINYYTINAGHALINKKQVSSIVQLMAQNKV